MLGGMSDIQRAEVWRHPSRPGAFEWRLLAVEDARNTAAVVERSKRQWGNAEDARTDLERSWRQGLLTLRSST
jgi:hypothetical protein